MSQNSEDKIRVLIADDVACMRDSLRTVFSLDPSFEIVGEASDGAEAVKLAAHLRPDVVLIDLEMPCWDGYEAIRELSERKLSGAVVALTIHSDAASRARARAAGASMFLPKGTPIAQLVSAVRRAAKSSSWNSAANLAARRMVARAGGDYSVANG